MPPPATGHRRRAPRGPPQPGPRHNGRAPRRRPGPSAGGPAASAHSVTPGPRNPPGRHRPAGRGHPDRRAPPGLPGRTPAGTRSSRLGRGEERLPEAERHRSAHHGEGEVEQIGHRSNGATDQHAGRSTTPGRQPGRPAGEAAIAVPDASASRHPRPPQVHGRPSGTTQRGPCGRRCRAGPPAADRRARSRPRHRSTRPWRRSPAARRRTDPSLAERQRLGVVVDEGRQPGQLADAHGAGRRHAAMLSGETSSPRGHRAPAPHAAHDRRSPGSAASVRLHQLRQVTPEGLSVLPRRAGRPRRPCHHGAVVGHQSSGQLGAADVDGEGEVGHEDVRPVGAPHEPGRGAAGPPRAQPSRRWKRERNQSRASLTAPSIPLAAPADSTPRPSIGSGRAIRPGPCDAVRSNHDRGGEHDHDADEPR